MEREKKNHTKKSDLKNVNQVFCGMYDMPVDYIKDTIYNIKEQKTILTVKIF